MIQIDNPYAPIEEIKLSLFNEKGLQLYLKREDLSHPFISGNKWRKLKYHILLADSQNKKHLVTFGGAYSNHLLATAACAAKYGFKATGFVRGEEVTNPVLQLCNWFGMKLIFCSRQEYKNKHSLYNSYFKDEVSCFFIDEGGAGELGETGVKEMLSDITEPYDIICCSVGTGSTFKALTEAVIRQQMQTCVYGISVLKGAFSLDRLVENYPKNHWQLFHQFHEGGYAKTSEELLKFIKHFASETGILLDQVYEGKMMLAIYKLAHQNHFMPGTRILALHNGGLSGMLSLLQLEPKAFK